MPFGSSECLLASAKVAWGQKDLLLVLLQTPGLLACSSLDLLSVHALGPTVLQVILWHLTVSRHIMVAKLSELIIARALQLLTMAVLLPQDLMLMVGPLGEWVRYTVESPCVLAPECDGIRIISQTTHELLRRVPDPLADVFRPGSTAPGRHSSHFSARPQPHPGIAKWVI